MSIIFGLISSGIAGVLVFGLLLLLRPFTKKAFSKAWHYYSFVVPLFFLLGGTLIAGSLVNQAQQLRVENVQLFRMETDYVQPAPNAEVTQPRNSFYIPINMETDGSVFWNYAEENTVIPYKTNTPPASEQILRYVARFTPFIITVWAAGAFVFLGRSYMKYLQYRRFVLREAKIFNANDCPIPIVISETAHTPMLIGLLKPVIVLPKMQYAEKELAVILTHELTHYRRKDLLYKMVGLLALAAHWYNPAAHILNKQLSTFCELSCDEKVASEMDAAHRKFYGETILQVLQHSATQWGMVGNLMFATNLCNSKTNTKRRLISMMNGKKMKKSVAVLAVAAMMLVVGGGFAIAHWAESAVPVYAAVLENDEVPVYADAPAYDDVPAYTTKPEYIAQTVNTTALEPITIYYNGVSVGIEAHPDAEPTRIYLTEITTAVSDSIALLAYIYEGMGNIMFPTYFPEGFAVTRVGVNNSRDDAIARGQHVGEPGGFEHLNSLMVMISNGEHSITLQVRLFQPYNWVNREHIRMTADDLPDLFYGQQHTVINGMNAVIGRYGRGLTLRDIDNGLEYRFPANANTAFPHTGTIYQFMACPNSGVLEEDLIRMAESLVHILDLM